VRIFLFWKRDDQFLQNEVALESFYKKERKSPVLGSEEFRERLLAESITIDREYPRYERMLVRPSVDQVLQILAKTYGLKVDDLLIGRRGRDNEPGSYFLFDLFTPPEVEIVEILVLGPPASIELF
jgi:hypothetical protein